MPSVASKMSSVEELQTLFPLTLPVPTPDSVPDLITPKDLYREENLLRNPQSFQAWWSTIHTAREAFVAENKLERSDLSESVAALLGPLATPFSRISLQRLTYLYESALVHFPNSFKLWKSYLTMRMSFVLGKQIVKKRAGGRKKFPEMKDALVEEREDLEQWEGGLNGIIGWEEWKSLIATFERALMWLPNLPRLWLMYLSIFFHPMCPPLISYTHARHTFDRVLRTLPPSLHSRIWVRYLLWAESRGGSTLVAVYRRYITVDPSVTENFTHLLLHPIDGKARPLEAAKLLLSLARKAAKGEYHSPEGKSPYQLLGDWIEVVEKFSDDRLKNEAGTEPASVDGKLMRIAGPAVTVDAAGKPLPSYDEDEDYNSPRKLNIERIIAKDGFAVYKDQAGRLWTGLATYWVKRGEFERAKETFEKGLATESLISAMMEALADEEDEEEAAETEKELDVKMKEFEELMDRRPFLINSVLIRRNPNDVQEWEKLVALWGEDDEKVAETYTKALETINPRKATANLHRLYVNFAKFYEEGGTTGQAEPDLDSARKILEKGTKVNFKAVEDLAEVWCEWAELEVRHDNYDEAIRVMQRAAAIPKNTKINYHDHTLSAQTRLFKSLKLWSFYVDLEESIGTVETTKTVYDKILDLRIANAQIIVNYAAFLEENKYFEESFKVYDRGVELFTFPISFELWNIYLAKFVKRYCPPKSCKPIFLMYAKLEEEYGLAKRAMSIYDRATQVIADEDRFEMFTIYIAKATENYGLPATRSIYERALEVLPDRQTAEMCLRFAALERKLGEIDRARAIYAHASQFCDPRVNPQFWSEWNAFEYETGSEDTFREMLRIKRSVQAQFNTEASYIAAQTMAARQGTRQADAVENASDAMAAAEREAGNAPAFVAATQTALHQKATDADAPATTANADEIHISDDEDL
ncbi:spliceosome complex protein [Gymnopus androsaceus JB14]|uniref:Pre-mRNA-splicing factor SYF1 n=1 Tax=Gymnopus androsaceus JB14 TaxID=1447944 RepID=A0A6A4HB64_9AGAR|nr:spliceosome complex protein [Gymnopus androsaceus JB14]